MEPATLRLLTSAATEIQLDSPGYGESARLMNTPVPPDQLAAIQDCIFHGQKIQAIKLHRQATGFGLKESKEAVEAMETELRQTSREKFTVAPAGKGCLGMLVICAAVVVVVLWVAMQ